MKKMKIRLALSIFSAILTILLSIFVWIMMNASSNPMSKVLFKSLFIVSSITLVAQIIYSLKGQIFELDGQLAKNEILFAIICFQLIMQLGFGFSLFAVNQTALQNDSYDTAYSYFMGLQERTFDNSKDEYQKINLTTNMPECIGNIFITEADYYDTIKYIHFPIDDGMLIMEKSQRYFNSRLREFAINLLMSLIISILLMIELVFLMAKLLM